MPRLIKRRTLPLTRDNIAHERVEALRARIKHVAHFEGVGYVAEALRESLTPGQFEELKGLLCDI